MDFPMFEGIFAATVTPFSDDGERLDLDALDRLTERLIGAGVAGLVPCGSTGEFPHLSTEERRIVAARFVEAAAGRVPVIVHTGALTTRETVELSVHAARVGATAVMVVPPFYDVITFPELVDHFRAVADASGMPIVLYNIPSITGVDLPPARIAELAEQVPAVRYVKDTSGNAPALVELVERYGDTVATFNGWDTLTFLGLAAGTRASIWGAVNMMPSACVELFDLVVRREDLAGARRLWSRIWPVLHFAETCGSYGAAIKAGCAIVGEPVGPPRRPFRPLDRGQYATLERLMAEAGLLSRPATAAVVG